MAKQNERVVLCKENMAQYKGKTGRLYIMYNGKMYNVLGMMK